MLWPHSYSSLLGQAVGNGDAYGVMAYLWQNIPPLYVLSGGLWEGSRDRPPHFGFGKHKNHVLEVNRMVISGYLPL